MYQNIQYGTPTSRQQVRYGFMSDIYPYYITPEQRQRLFGFAGETIRKNVFGMK